MPLTTPEDGSIRIVEMPDLGAVTDASSMVGERAGSGRFAAPAFRAYVDMITATGSTTPRSNSDRWATIANVFDYGAVGDGVTDDTAAIQAAVDTGRRVYLPRPPVAYLVRNAINIITLGQTIEGDGKGVSIINIDATFNMSALGVFVTPGGPWVPGPQFRDFQINFYQPDTSDNASLVHYPAAFWCQKVARATWHRVKISGSLVGIDLRVNAAGSSIVDCELCCFDWHIYLDGEADSVTVESTRFEPDLLTANQRTLYHTSARGILSGRCDDLHVEGCLFFCGLGIQLIVSVDGTSTTFGSVTNCDFDTYAGINMASGNVQVAGCGFTLGTATSYAIQMAGGNLSVSTCWFLAVSAFAGNMIGVTGNLSLQVANSRFDLLTDCVAVNATGNANVIITGCQFNPAQIVHAQPMVAASSAALLNMSGCRFSVKIGGSGQALNCPADATHNVTGNAFGGWTTTMLAGPLHVFANNNV